MKINDSTSVLFARVQKAAEPVKNQAFKADLLKRASAIHGLGDDPELRSTMVRVLGEAGSYARFERRMDLEVKPSWDQAQIAWTEWVNAEILKGNDGHEAMNRAFGKRYAALQDRTSHLWENGPDAMDELLKELEGMTYEVANYVQPWCNHPGCGVPMFPFLNTKTGKMVDPKACSVHYVATKQPAKTLAPKAVAPGKRAKQKRHAAARALRANGPIKKNQPKADGGKKKAKKVAKATKRGEGK